MQVPEDLDAKGVLLTMIGSKEEENIELRTMKAIQLDAPGPPQALHLRDLPIPQPTAGWVRIRVEAFGLNRSELHLRLGLAEGVTFPRVPGMECAGVVDAAPGTSFRLGQQVVAMMGGMGRVFDGGYAECTVVPASQVIPIRTDLPWEVVARSFLSLPGGGRNGWKWYRADVSATNIRPCTAADLPALFSIVNDAAQAYKGVIPADCWHEPYMPLDELKQGIRDGVVFWGYETGGELVGLMGIQDRGAVSLIRHAYVQTVQRRKGIGEKLLRRLEGMTAKPILIGTWSAAAWAIRFYEKNGYRALSRPETERLLREYWSIPERQIETSVVLANARWKS